MVTIADVARHAGVSSSTVSYVISGKRAISEGTRRRVERSIVALGYHPNAGARALASSRSHIIALVVPLRGDVYVPIMMEIAIAVTTAARGYGYDVLLVTNDEGVDGLRRVAGSGLADGVILMDVQLRDERIPVLRQLGTHAALIGLPEDTDGLACVDHDFAAAGALCADHLADLGHRDVAFIGYADRVYQRHMGYADRTLTGFRERAEARGLRILHRPSEGSYEGTAGTLTRIFEDRPGTTGFVVQNEGALGPLLSLLRSSGRIVPEEASVVALCQPQLAEQTSPRLTSVSGPADELGRRAVDLLMKRVEAPADGTGPAADDEARRAGEVCLLTPVLTPRDSSGPAPR